MSTGSSKPVVTTETKTPWSGSIPHLTNVMGDAQSLYSGDVGYHPYMGQTQAAVDPLVSQGMGAAQSFATGDISGSQGVNAALGNQINLQNGQGLSPGQMN